MPSSVEALLAEMVEKAARGIAERRTHDELDEATWNAYLADGRSALDAAGVPALVEALSGWAIPALSEAIDYLDGEDASQTWLAELRHALDQSRAVLGGEVSSNSRSAVRSDSGLEDENELLGRYIGHLSLSLRRIADASDPPLTVRSLQDMARDALDDKHVPSSASDSNTPTPTEGSGHV